MSSSGWSVAVAVVVVVVLAVVFALAVAVAVVVMVAVAIIVAPELCVWPHPNSASTVSPHPLVTIHLVLGNAEPSLGLPRPSL
jgi:predicted cobalt transporter CbtA